MDKEYVVSGIIFRSEEEYNDALSDEKNIEYISSKINMSDTATLIKLYKSLIKKRTLKTTVGFVFLKKIYDEILLSEDYIENDIPVIDLSEYIDGYGVDESASQMKTEEEVNNKLKKKKNKTAKKEYPVNIELEKSKNINKLLSGCIVLLIATVIAMFFITLKSDTITYNNAKNSVINDYEEWENELSEREKEIIRKEEELGINLDE